MNFSSYENLREILQSVKSYIDQHTPDNVVYSVSLNNGSVIKPDTNGNVNLDIPMPDLSSYIKTSDKFWLINIYGKENWSFGQLMGDSQADPLATKSYVDAKVPNLTGIIKTVSVNKGAQVGPDTNGNADLTINTYTLELDGGSGANITASIDNGDPVSKDSNNNINLNVPDNYIDVISGWGKTFTNENTPLYDEDGNAIPHTINLGFIGKPRFYAKISSKPAFGTLNNPSFIYIEVPSDGIIELNGYDDEYVKISQQRIIEAKGNVWCFKAKYGNFAGGFFIGIQKGFMIDILSIGSYSKIKICTSTEQSDYGTQGVFEYIDLKTWERNIVGKGWTRAEILALITEQAYSVTWVYKPVVRHPETYDKNTVYPNMIYEVGGTADDVQDLYGEKFIYINFPTDTNLEAGQYIFRNKYVGAMDGADYVYRMPFYDMDLPDGTWILMDFVLGNSTKTRDNRDYHCKIVDWNMNPLIDVKMHNFAGTTHDYTIEQHIYYRLRYHKERRFWEVYNNADLR